MKKFAFAAAAILFIGACAIPLPRLPAPSPIVDSAGTAEALLQTAIIQTLTAQPTITFAPAVSSATPTLPIAEATLTSTETPTLAAEPTNTIATGTFEVPTATDFVTPLPTTGLISSSQTPGVLTYGTLPPAVPFSNITLINRAKTQAYISLQVVTAEGGPTIIEYPVRGQIKIEAPVGQYLYVAWVGGRKMVGEFRLHRDEDLEILLYRDQVVIK